MRQNVSQKILLDQENALLSFTINGNLLLNLQGHSDLQEFLFEPSAEKREKKQVRPEWQLRALAFTDPLSEAS